MARPRQVILLFVLLSVLITMLAILGQGIAKPGLELHSARSSGSLWPLGGAIAIAAVLLMQELRHSPRSAIKPEQDAVVVRVEQEISESTQVVQVRPTTASQTSSRPSSVMGEYTPNVHGITRSDLEHLLVRAIEASQNNVTAICPQHPSGTPSGGDFGAWRDGFGQSSLQRRAGVMTAHKVAAIQRMMVEELQNSIMVKISCLASTFHAWRCEARLERGARHFDQKLGIRQAEWDARQDEERKQFEAEEEVLKERQELLSRKWGQKMSLMLDQWAFGDVTGLYIQFFRAWHAYVEREQLLREEMRTTEKVARCAMGALCKWLDGDALGAAHSCFLAWKSEAARSLAERVHDRKLLNANTEFDEERKNWERHLEDKSKSHADDRRAYMTKEQIRQQKAHEATELMLSKWIRGDASGLLVTIVAEWKRYVDDMNALQARRQSVHVAVLRFLDGDQRGLMHAIFLNWKGYTQEQLVYKNEVAEHSREISKLQERSRSLLGSEKSRLLKYSTILGSQDKRVLALMVLAGWRMEAQGLAAEELHRQQEIELEERKRLHDLALAKHHHHLAASLRCLGTQDDQMLTLDAFSAWSQLYLARKQQWEHTLARNEAAEKYARFILGQFDMRDGKALMAAVFYEFLREVHRELHERERAEARSDQEELEETIKRAFGVDTSRLQEELRLAYAQYDKITETLQRELKTKEELAQELHDACHRLRQQSLQIESKRSQESEVVEEVLTARRRVSRHQS